MENIEDIKLDDLEEECPIESIPDTTRWKKVTNCCGLSVLLVMPTDRLFIQHWEVSLCIPILIALVLIYSASIYSILILRYLANSSLKIISLFEVFFFLVLFIWSYCESAFSDPGFLPFDWIRTKKTLYSWEEQLTGLAIRPDQIEFAQAHHPPFASFSEMSGRFIIRADHFCGWITNWVGKRNHKVFILMNLYGSILCLSMCFWTVYMMLLDIKDIQSMFVHFTISMIFELFFGIYQFIFFCINISNAISNQTQIQQWKQLQPARKNWCTGIREVFGNGNVCCYLCPTKAFHGEILMEELVSQSSQTYH